MKKLHPSIIILGLLVALLATYFYAPIMDREFISRTPVTCAAISYTCPQYQAAFTTGLACGCVPTNIEQDDPDQRTLQALIERHLQARAETTDPAGEMMVTTAQLGLSELPNGLLAYDGLAAYTEYVDRDGVLVKVTEHFRPVQLHFEEAGRYYIIRKTQFVEADIADDLTAVFGAETAEWLLDDSETSARLSIEAQLMQQNKIKGIQRLKVGPAVGMPTDDNESEA